jgi:hypothetical protein
LVNLGSEELARINEEFAANLSSQIQSLTNAGLTMSTLIADVTARNHRDRDERIQALNDRLMREKLENQHRLHEQRVAMRSRTMDGIDRVHGARQEVLRYQASLITGTYSLLAETRSRILAGKQAIFSARDANARYGVEVKSSLHSALQQVRQKTMESLDRIYQLRDIFAKWESESAVKRYEQIQQIEAQFLSAIDKQLAARQDVNRFEVSQQAALLTQAQSALSGLISGKEKYAVLVMQNANTLAEHKHKAIVERMNAAVQRLDGWKTVAAQNKELMAYQLDERNKLLIGLYSFVERREDTSPQWAEMSKMIAGLSDSGGGWLTP